MPTAAIIDVTDATFERDVLEASKTQPVVVDFWAAWCGPCRALSPIIEEAVTDHGGVTLAKLDTDANPRATAAFRIQGIPAVKGFRDGKLVSEFVGLQPRAAVDQFLNALAPAPAAAVAVPTDEAGLRTLLTDHADNIEARRSLAWLLFDAGRTDDALAVVSEAPNDPVCDGIRARIELAQAGLPEASHLGHDDVAAIPALITSLKSQQDDNRSRLRRVIVGLIESAREHPDAELYRTQLANALY